MRLSTVSINDLDTIHVDESGRSVAYFCRKAPIIVDSRLIAELKEASIQRDGKSVRLCLHESPDAIFHEMIILQHGGDYYRPHMHPVNGESYHIIEGSMACFVFDETGQVIDANVLEKGGNLLYRVGHKMYHAVVPLSEVLIYREVKAGPFISEEDSIFAPWAPDGSDAADALEYTDDLLKHL